jgi:hypothetical protein
MAAYAVFDRRTGTFTEQRNVTTQFRSASVVKILIALDFLWNRGPTYAVPAADRTRLDPMLRSSDDAAASYYWQRNGGSQIVVRMAQRLGLPHAAPPPAGYPTYWGYTALSVTDVVRMYRYLVDTAPAPVRDYVMGNLRAATRCATDGYDQYFGIPSAVNRPWAVKQGWSGFGSANPCGAAGTRLASVDLTGEALHTTGTVGAGDRAIVVVLTLHPDGTPYAQAGATLTRLVRSLRIPGAVPAPPPPVGTWFGTWGTGVRVRSAPSTGSAVVTTLPAGADVLVGCQTRGELVVVDPYRNDWWAYLRQYGGYMTNIFIRSPENQLPGVPQC